MVPRGCVAERSSIIKTQPSLLLRSIVETREFKLKDQHVRLCDLLKLAGIADSGGQGKHMVAAGEVRVDGQPEARKTAKIRAGQTVECLGVRVVVLAQS